MKESIIKINGYSFIIKVVNEKYFQEAKTLNLLMEDKTNLYVSEENVILFEEDSLVIDNLKKTLEKDDSKCIISSSLETISNQETKALVNNDNTSIIFDVKGPNYDENGRALLYLNDKTKLYASSNKVMFFDSSSSIMQQVITFLAHSGENVYKQIDNSFVKVRPYKLK